MFNKKPVSINIDEEENLESDKEYLS